MGAEKSFKEQSRSDFKNGEFTHESIRTGAIQRIADAVEVMCKDRVQLEKYRDWYKNTYNERQQRIVELENQVRTLKGVITRFKNQIKKAKMKHDYKELMEAENLKTID